MTRVRLRSEDDSASLSYLVTRFSPISNVGEFNDFQVKTTTCVNGDYFSNLTISNYRQWSVEDPHQDVIRLPRSSAAEYGVEIVGDYNDRFRFSETKDYRTTREMAASVVEGGLQEVESGIRSVNEGES